MFWVPVALYSPCRDSAVDVKGEPQAADTDNPAKRASELYEHAGDFCDPTAIPIALTLPA